MNKLFITITFILLGRIGLAFAWHQVNKPPLTVEQELERKLAGIPNYKDVNDLPPFESERDDQLHYDRLSDRTCEVDNIYGGTETPEDERRAILSYCETAQPIDVTLVCSHVLPGVCLGMEYELKYNPLYNTTNRIIIDYDPFEFSRASSSEIENYFSDVDNYIVVKFERENMRTLRPVFINLQRKSRGQTFPGRGPDLLPYKIVPSPDCIFLEGCPVIDSSKYVQHDEWIKGPATREILAESTHDVLEDIIQQLGRE